MNIEDVLAELEQSDVKNLHTESNGIIQFDIEKDIHCKITVGIKSYARLQFTGKTFNGDIFFDDWVKAIDALEVIVTLG